jgi:pilus assembly protein CpaD
MYTDKTKPTPRLSTLLLPVLVATVLSGCALTEDEPFANSFVPYSVNDRYPLAAVKGPVSLQVEVSRGKLQKGQVSAVTGISRQIISSGVTPVVIAVPTGGGKSSGVAREIGELLVHNGVDISMIRYAKYNGEANAPVQVSFIRTYAATRECGIWDKDYTDTASNQAATNHGCAVRANMAAMIANPKDIEVPAAMAKSTAAQHVVAIDKLGDTTSGSDFFGFFF